MNYRNTPIDFNPSRTTNATISAAGLTFPNGTVIAPDAEGCINLDYSATLFINTSGNIRVTTLNDSPGIANSYNFVSSPQVITSLTGTNHGTIANAIFFLN